MARTSSDWSEGKSTMLLKTDILKEVPKAIKKKFCEIPISKTTYPKTEKYDIKEEELQELGIPSSRSDTISLLTWFTGIKAELNKIQENDFDEKMRLSEIANYICFKELTRQISVHCTERGVLMWKIWEEYHKFISSLNAYSNKKIDKLQKGHEEKEMKLHNTYESEINDVWEQNNQFKEKISELNSEIQSLKKEQELEEKKYKREIEYWLAENGKLEKKIFQLSLLEEKNKKLYEKLRLAKGNCEKLLEEKTKIENIIEVLKGNIKHEDKEVQENPEVIHQELQCEILQEITKNYQMQTELEDSMFASSKYRNAEVNTDNISNSFLKVANLSQISIGGKNKELLRSDSNSFKKNLVPQASFNSPKNSLSSILEENKDTVSSPKQSNKTTKTLKLTKNPNNVSLRHLSSMDIISSREKIQKKPIHHPANSPEAQKPRGTPRMPKSPRTIVSSININKNFGKVSTQDTIQRKQSNTLSIEDRKINLKNHRNSSEELHNDIKFSDISEPKKEISPRDVSSMPTVKIVIPQSPIKTESEDSREDVDNRELHTELEKKDRIIDEFNERNKALEIENRSLTQLIQELRAKSTFQEPSLFVRKEKSVEGNSSPRTQISGESLRVCPLKRSSQSRFATSISSFQSLHGTRFSEFQLRNRKTLRKKRDLKIIVELKERAAQQNHLIQPISLKMLYRFISGYYAAFIEQLRNSVTSQQCLSVFIYNELTQKFGLKQMADRKFMQILVSCMANRGIQRVRMFGRFIGIAGIDEEIEEYTYENFKSYIEMLDFMKVVVEFDSKIYVPFQRAIDCARLHFELKLPPVELSSLIISIETLKCPDPKGKLGEPAIDFDLFAEKMISIYLQLLAKAKAVVEDVFLSADLDLNGLLTVDEFELLMNTMEPFKYSIRTILEVFTEFADVTDDNVEYLSLNSLASIAAKKGVLSIAAQNKFLGKAANTDFSEEYEFVNTNIIGITNYFKDRLKAARIYDEMWEARLEEMHKRLFDPGYSRRVVWMSYKLLLEITANELRKAELTRFFPRVFQSISEIIPTNNLFSVISK